MADKCRSVLIVPLWNWNDRLPACFVVAYLVLIVPLWNWNSIVAKTIFTLECSNRTFMELKFIWLTLMLRSFSVLIVPLWNWNLGRSFYLRLLDYVLIVPLWNWNTTTRTNGFSISCSNRTFMELKSHSLYRLRRLLAF